MSTNTGLAPSREMQPAEAKNVNGLVITSSPGPMPNAMRLQSKASVPLETPIPYLQFDREATAASNSATLGPPIQTCESRTAVTACRISALIGAYCALRSNKGICIQVSCNWFELMTCFQRGYALC